MLKLGRYWPWKTVSSHLNAILSILSKHFSISGSNTESFPPVPSISQSKYQLRIPVKDPVCRLRIADCGLRIPNSCFYAANANTEKLSWKSHCSLCACRKTDLNLRLVEATTNTFISSNHRFTNEIWGYAWPVLIVIIDDGILLSKYGIDRSPRNDNLN